MTELSISYKLKPNGVECTVTSAKIGREFWMVLDRAKNTRDVILQYGMRMIAATICNYYDGITAKFESHDKDCGTLTLGTSWGVFSYSVTIKGNAKTGYTPIIHVDGETQITTVEGLRMLCLLHSEVAKNSGMQATTIHDTCNEDKELTSFYGISNGQEYIINEFGFALLDPIKYTVRDPVISSIDLGLHNEPREDYRQFNLEYRSGHLTVKRNRANISGNYIAVFMSRNGRFDLRITRNSSNLRRIPDYRAIKDYNPNGDWELHELEQFLNKFLPLMLP